MSSIVCPDCKRRIAHTTSGCPVCGFHIENWWQRVGHRRYALWRQRWQRRWALIASLLLMITLSAWAKPIHAAKSDQASAMGCHQWASDSSSSPAAPR